MSEFFSYRGQFILPLASILSELNTVHNFPSYLFKAESTNFPKVRQLPQNSNGLKGATMLLPR